MSVTARPLTRILEITYSDRSASSAQAGAQRAAEGFLAARDRIVIQPVREYLSEVAKENQQLEETRNVLEETNSTIDGTRLVEWQERAVLAELEVPGPGSVVEQSHITSTGDRGDVEVPVVTGLCFGGLLGLVAGQLRDRQYGRRTSSGAVRNDRQSQSGALPGDSGNARMPPSRASDNGRDDGGV